MTAFWRKSSRSFSNGNCVEVAELPGGSVGVRNSRDPAGPVLRFTRGEWDAFLRHARLGKFATDAGYADITICPTGTPFSVIEATVR